MDDAHKIFNLFKEEIDIFLTRKAIDTIRKENQALVKYFFINNFI